MIYIGIDNGLSGGLAAVDYKGQMIDSIIMPTRNKAKGNEIDAVEVYEWIRSMRSMSVPTQIVLETPGKFSKGVQAIASMWDSYGVLRAICEVSQLRHHRITPQQWQKKMLVGCKRGDTKPAALQKAKQLWPMEEFLPTPRCKKPHDGMIDAALMAEYARISNL